jgi:hypothetical protein
MWEFQSRLPIKRPAPKGLLRFPSSEWSFSAGLHGFSGALLVCLSVNPAKVCDQPMSSSLEDITWVMQKACGKDISPFEESFLLKTLEKRLTSTWINSLTAYSF